MIARGPGAVPESGLRQQVEQAEGDEQDREDDREAEERALDPAPAAIRGHLPTERTAQAGPRCWSRIEAMSATARMIWATRSADCMAGAVYQSGRGTAAYASSRERPVISGPGRMPISAQSVGATSASIAVPQAGVGVGGADEDEGHRRGRVLRLRVALGIPHLLDVAVIGGDDQRRHRPRAARPGTRPGSRRRPRPPRPRPTRRRCGRPCRGSRSSR